MGLDNPLCGALGYRDEAETVEEGSGFFVEGIYRCGGGGRLVFLECGG